MINTYKILIAAALCLALTACTQTSPTTNNSNKLSLTAEYKYIVADNVIQAAHQKHLAENGGKDSHYSLNNRLKIITQKIIDANGLGAKNINITLLKSASVNAYSLSSNSRFAYVYVTRGLTEFIANEDQMAAVIAHEIAHIILRHHLKRQKSSSSQFNQAQELEADRHSIPLLQKAGYKVIESVKLLERLDILQAKQKFINKADYPSNDKRIQSLNKVISSL